MTDLPPIGRPSPRSATPGVGELEADRRDTVANALAVLRRRWAVLATCVLACVLVALLLHARRDQTY